MYKQLSDDYFRSHYSGSEMSNIGPFLIGYGDMDFFKYSVTCKLFIFAYLFIYWKNTVQFSLINVQSGRR